MGRRAKGTGGVTKLSSGRWRARIANSDGKFRYATFTLKSKADAWLRESTSGDPTAQKGTFAAVAARGRFTDFRYCNASPVRWST